jgi:hypothetical protein
MLLNSEAEVRSKIRHAITRAELIDDPEAMGEHMLLEVPRMELPSNGHMSVHDWWGTEIVENMKGL